jgi:endo-1,4-beta-xylanase
MFSFKIIALALFAGLTLAQGQQFYVQNWGNGDDATDYDYESLEAGRFTVDWVLGAGGNFVVGKGYRVQTCTSSTHYTLPYTANTISVWSITPQTTTPRGTPTSPSTASQATRA